MPTLARGWSRTWPAVSERPRSRASAEIAATADFECLEDLRLHSAAPPESSDPSASSRSGRQRIPPVDWTADGRFDLSSYAEAFAMFRRLRTLEVNHASLPNLIPLTKSMISHSHPGSGTTGPDLVADQMRAWGRARRGGPLADPALSRRRPHLRAQVQPPASMRLLLRARRPLPRRDHVRARSP